MSHTSAESHSSAVEASDPDQLTAAREEGLLPHGPATSTAGNRLPWSICALLIAALLVSHWWFERRIDLLSRQLVATQDSFARVSEGASAEMQEISGQVKDNSSRVILRQDSLQQQVQELLGRLDEASQRLQQQALQLREQDQQLVLLLEANRQQISRLDLMQARQGEIETLNDERSTQHEQQLQHMDAAGQALATRLETLEQREDPAPRVSALESRLDELQTRQGQTASALDRAHSSLEQQQQDLQDALTGLNTRYAGNDSLNRLEDEILVLRSTMDNQPKPTAPRAEISRREFDAFRLQTTRHITTLQEQWRNLQRQQQ